MKSPANKTSAQNGRSTLTILSALFVIILLGLAIGVTYTLQQRHVDSLNQQITDLNKQLAIAKAQTEPATPPNSTTPNQTTYTSGKSVSIKVFSPQSNDKVANPLAIIGEVPGNWSFEASFPIKLLDSSGKVIAQTSAQVLGSWTTDSFVPFSAKLTWSSVETGKGTLVLQKDNPSGLAENDDSVSIPITF